MREIVTESIILGSTAPGLTAFSMGLHWLGAILLVVLIIVALAIIGRTNNNKKETL